MSIFAFGDKHPSFLRKNRSEILLLPPRLHSEHQDDEMRDDQSETETAESAEETSKRQGCPIVRIVHAPTRAESVIDEIEVTLKEDDSVAAATEKNEKKGEKKTVTFAEEIRVEEFEVDRTKKMKKTRRNRRKRRAHDIDELDDDDDESDDDEPLAILSCSLPLSKRHNLRCGCRLFLPLMCDNS